MVNNIKYNTICEVDAKKHLNTLNKIKNVEIKYKRLIPGQKEEWEWKWEWEWRWLWKWRWWNNESKKKNK